MAVTRLVPTSGRYEVLEGNKTVAVTGTSRPTGFVIEAESYGIIEQPQA